MLTVQTAHRKDLRGKPKGFQHRHYAGVAAIIRTLQLNDAEREEAAHHFATELAAFNTNFNRDRFLSACEVTK
jgi:hypothetical protein